MANNTLAELKQLQNLPLEIKIIKTQNRIREWVDYWGLENVYISFSGGKDSTVLLDIARKMYPDIKAMFVDVPTQFPELKQFVMEYENVDIVYPRKNFMQVVKEYGFPLISKEVAECVQGARKYLTSIANKENALTEQNRTEQNRTEQNRTEQNRTEQSLILTSIDGLLELENTQKKKMEIIPKADEQSMLDNSRGGMTTSTENLEELANFLNENKGKVSARRTALLLGILAKDNEIKANIPKTDRSQFSQEKYKFLLDAPFEISNKCCDVMKKNPAHDYEKKTGRKPIIATMAEESKLRTQKWLQQGCNSFDGNKATSKPMSFWKEQDVLKYIQLNNLPICSVYGDIVTDYKAMGQLEGQMSFVSDGVEKLKTTGCKRTGCVLCGFGCHIKKENNRFAELRETHPGLHTLLDKIENNGVTYRKAIDWVNENGNFTIKY